MGKAVYLDCNATTPLEPAVLEAVKHFLSVEYGNAASRTHDYGTMAKKAVEKARESIASVVGAKRDEVVFTSGATESNNIAILGLAAYGQKTGKKHIVSTGIEHKAVLEPLQHLGTLGFEVSIVAPEVGGWVDPRRIRDVLREDTLLVSVMHANNETGILQPIEDIAEAMAGSDSFFHVDGAQTFGKELAALRLQRIDFISISGHKVYGPKGIGALVVRRRGFDRIPLEPLTYGGGHERGLRPGTLPVELIAGLGMAAELALAEHDSRKRQCLEFRKKALKALGPLEPQFNGAPEMCMAHVMNVSFPGLDSEAVIVALKDIIAFSNGSACTSHSYEPSHVLQAMGLSPDRVQQAIRLSWSHLTPEVPWSQVVDVLGRLKA